MNMTKKKNRPSSQPSWQDHDELRRVAEFHDSLTEEKWIAHYESGYEQEGYTDLLVPKNLMPTVDDMIAQAEHDREVARAKDPAIQPEEESQAPAEGDFPPGWNAARVQRLIAEMEEEEANWTEEDEAELQRQLKGKASVMVPDELVPAITELIARAESESNAATGSPAF